MTALPSPFSCRVVGVSFIDYYPMNLSKLAGITVTGEPLAAILVRNPGNTHDANAVEVHVPDLGDRHGMIGYIMAPVAARLALEMDAGQAWTAEVVEVLVYPDNPSQPGISIRLQRKDTPHGE